jgi:hypothetical protein
MAVPFYQRRIHSWMDQFDHGIDIAQKRTFKATARSTPSDTSTASRCPSGLDRHIDDRLVLKSVKYHPYLLDILLKKLDEGLAAIPEDIKIHQSTTSVNSREL